MAIETERLLLREMTYDDFHALYQVLADSNIMQHYSYTFDENAVRKQRIVLPAVSVKVCVRSIFQ